eukprot:5739656-Pyramimonas_sp.AAC.1
MAIVSGEGMIRQTEPALLAELPRMAIVSGVWRRRLRRSCDKSRKTMLGYLQTMMFCFTNYNPRHQYVGSYQ